jgi:aryl-alcohol dehydrogenase-like predicted oxidoreductase
VRREIEKNILPFCLSQNIGVIVYSPMYAGLLTGAMTPARVASFLAEDWRRNLPGFQEPALSRNLRVAEHLREIGRGQGRSPGEVAIAWTLNHPAVTGAIVGFRSPKQVEGIIGAANFRLTQNEIEQIEGVLKKENAV